MAAQVWPLLAVFGTNAYGNNRSRWPEKSAVTDTMAPPNTAISAMELRIKARPANKIPTSKNIKATA